MPPLIQAEVQPTDRSYRLPVVRQTAPVGYGSVDAWPSDARFILSAIDAGNMPAVDRRAVDRTPYRVVADLKLCSDRSGVVPWVLYCRDVAPRALGFITRHCLPLGYGGVIFLRGPNNEDLSIDCTVRRCRAAVNGWYEGALSFNRDQWALGANNFHPRATEP